jgi:regulatory protein
MNEKDLLEVLYQKAVRRIAARPRSEKETREFLVKKLSRYKLAESDISRLVETLIQSLREENLVNDADFVAWWAEQRAYFKPKGTRALKVELSQKGVQKKLVDDFFEDNPIEEEKTAQVVLGKRRRMYEGLPRPEQYRKVINFLLRRGFSIAASKKAFEETFEIE